MQATALTTPCDLSRAAFQDAVGLLRVAPSKVTLFCGKFSICNATLLAEEFRCKIVIVPDEILHDQHHWAVSSKSAIVWSSGV